MLFYILITLISHIAAIIDISVWTISVSEKVFESAKYVLNSTLISMHKKLFEFIKCILISAH
jgi:hypothetical protein